MLVESEDEDTLARLEELITNLRASRSRLAPSFNNENSSPCSDEDTGESLRDLTASAVWSVSTAKAGNGAEQLLDGSPDTYWQSDGVQPHTITAQFSAKRRVKAILLFLNYQTDESYTPAAISVRAGSNFHDLRVVRSPVEFESPQGWVRIPLGGGDDGVVPAGSPSSDEESSAEEEDVHLSAPQLARREQMREQRRRERADRNGRKREIREKVRVRRRETALEHVDHSYVNAHMVQIVIHCNHQNGRDSHVRMVKVLGTEKQVARTSPKFTSREFKMYEYVR